MNDTSTIQFPAKKVLAFLLLMCSVSLFSQRITKPEQIVKMAKSELSAGMEKTGDIYAFAKENNNLWEQNLAQRLGKGPKPPFKPLKTVEKVSIGLCLASFGL